MSLTNGNIENTNNSPESVDDLKHQLSSLAELIIDQTLDNLNRHYQNGDKDSFVGLLNKSKTYNNGIIVKRFIDSFNSVNKENLNGESQLPSENDLIEELSEIEIQNIESNQSVANDEHLVNNELLQIAINLLDEQTT